MSTNPQGQQAFAPQQLSMQGTTAQQSTPSASTESKAFQVETVGKGSGTLYIAHGFVRFVSQDKRRTPSEKFSWSASCDDIAKWRKDPQGWMGTYGEVQMWVREGYKEYKMRMNTKVEQDDILQALREACGRPSTEN
jgi:hypothetical protein